MFYIEVINIRILSLTDERHYEEKASFCHTDSLPYCLFDLQQRDMCWLDHIFKLEVMLTLL